MDCNCSHNKEISQCRVRHVYGNVLKIGVPLMLRTVTVEDGEIVTTDTEFIPSTNYPVSIELDNGRERPKFVATMEGNVARFEDAGTIPVGIYSLSVICKDDNGNPYRFKQRYVLQVVDTTKEAGIEEEIEFETQEWTLDGAIFLLMKGDKGDPGVDGVGIEDIQTVENPNHGEYNTVTIYLTDGTSKSFQVRNGWGGISGIVVNNTLYTQNANGVIDLGTIIRQHQSLANYVSESEFNTSMTQYYRKNEVDAMMNTKADVDELDDVARIDLNTYRLKKNHVYRIVLDSMGQPYDGYNPIPAEPNYYYQSGHLWYNSFADGIKDLGTPSTEVIYINNATLKQYIWREGYYGTPDGWVEIPTGQPTVDLAEERLDF